MEQKVEPTTGEIVRCARQCFGDEWDEKHCKDCLRATPYHCSGARVLRCRDELGIILADRIESQEATIAALTARAEQAEMERDKAKADMRFAANCVDGLCKICGNAECQERGDGCFMCRSFTWRGLPQDGEGK